MRTILYLLTAISCVLYAVAPEEYSYTFSLVCLAVYLLSSYLLLKNNCNDSFLKFETFFLVAFFFTNIVYSAFYYPINPYFFLFNLPFNENYINKGLALSVMASSFFCIGVLDNNRIQKECEKRNLFIPRGILYVLLLIFIFYQLTLVQKNVYTSEFTSSNINALLIFMIYYAVFALFYQYRGRSLRYVLSARDNIVFFLLLFVYIGLFLIIGYRTVPLSMLLLMLFFYDEFIHKIKLRTVLTLVVVGGALMMAVSVFRARGDFQYEGNSVLDLGLDLTINNRSLYVLMEHADKTGLTYGRSMLLSIFSAIPFGQSILLAITGWDVNTLGSARLVTSLYFDNEGRGEEIYGLGTNMIGDIYVSFGVIGVIVFMYLLGRLLKSLWHRKLNGELLGYFFYAMIFIEAIYITRAAYFEWLRNITWGMIWYLIFNSSNKSRRELA